jgi:SNF2 family DNA or RNA helicase
MVVTSWMQRLCGGYLPGEQCESWKYLYVQDLLNTELKGERVVVWCAFNDEISRLQSLLKPSSSVASLTGETSQEDRKSAIRKFRSKEVRILIVQQRLGKFGLDLSCSNTAVYFSNAYSLELRAQSEDRIVMPGKKEPLLYIDLITKNTVEEGIYNDLRDKKVDAKWLVARARKVDVH